MTAAFSTGLAPRRLAEENDEVQNADLQVNNGPALVETERPDGSLEGQAQAEAPSSQLAKKGSGPPALGWMAVFAAVMLGLTAAGWQTYGKLRQFPEEKEEEFRISQLDEADLRVHLAEQTAKFVNSWRAASDEAKTEFVRRYINPEAEKVEDSSLDLFTHHVHGVLRSREPVSDVVVSLLTGVVDAARVRLEGIADVLRYEAALAAAEETAAKAEAGDLTPDPSDPEGVPPELASSLTDLKNALMESTKKAVDVDACFHIFFGALREVQEQMPDAGLDVELPVTGDVFPSQQLAETLHNLSFGESAAAELLTKRLDEWTVESVTRDLRKTAKKVRNLDKQAKDVKEAALAEACNDGYCTEGEQNIFSFVISLL